MTCDTVIAFLKRLEKPLALKRRHFSLNKLASPAMGHWGTSRVHPRLPTD